MSKVLSSLYFNVAPYPPFKGVLMEHRNYIRSPMTRQYYHIIDLILWFESNHEEGWMWKTDRISENSKYYFTKHMRCFE